MHNRQGLGVTHEFRTDSIRLVLFSPCYATWLVFRCRCGPQAVNPGWPGLHPFKAMLNGALQASNNGVPPSCTRCSAKATRFVCARTVVPR